MFFIGLYAIFAIKYVRKELTGMKVYYCKKKFKRKFKEQKFQHFCSHFFLFFLEVVPYLKQSYKYIMYTNFTFIVKF